jgi:hypothetical protein
VDLEEGWVAEQYGVRERAPVIVLRRDGRLPARIETRIAPVHDFSDGHGVP